MVSLITIDWDSEENNAESTFADKMVEVSDWPYNRQVWMLKARA